MVNIERFATRRAWCPGTVTMVSWTISSAPATKTPTLPRRTSSRWSSPTTTSPRTRSFLHVLVLEVNKEVSDRSNLTINRFEKFPFSRRRKPTRYGKECANCTDGMLIINYNKAKVSFKFDNVHQIESCHILQHFADSQESSLRTAG